MRLRTGISDAIFLLTLIQLDKDIISRRSFHHFAPITMRNGRQACRNPLMLAAGAHLQTIWVIFAEIFSYGQNKIKMEWNDTIQHSGVSACLIGRNINVMVRDSTNNPSNIMKSMDQRRIQYPVFTWSIGSDTSTSIPRLH